jgi:hypothetical protein
VAEWKGQEFFYRLMARHVPASALGNRAASIRSGQIVPEAPATHAVRRVHIDQVGLLASLQGRNPSDAASVDFPVPPALVLQRDQGARIVSSKCRTLNSMLSSGAHVPVNRVSFDGGQN